MKAAPASRKADVESPDQFAPALALLAAGKLDAAHTALIDAERRYPNDARGANFLGVVCFQAGRVDDAGVHFARAAAIASGVSEYSYNEGMACFLLGKPEAAAIAFRRSLNGDKLLRQAHYWMWGAWEQLGIARDAIRQLRQALYNDPAQAHFEPVAHRPELNNVTLCVVDCKLPDLAARALRRSMAQCRFAEVKLFTSRAARYDGIETVTIDDISSIEDYSYFVMKSLGKHIDTQFALVTQWDGYVTRAAAWSDDFLEFDYIGARLRDELVNTTGAPASHNIGNGGFSLRSDMFLGAGSDPRIVKTHPEDMHMCGTYRGLLEEAYGMRFADVATADRFSFEIFLPETDPFGFHGFFNLCFFEADPKWMRFEFLDADSVQNSLR